MNDGGNIFKYDLPDHIAKYNSNKHKDNEPILDRVKKILPYNNIAYKTQDKFCIDNFEFNRTSRVTEEQQGSYFISASLPIGVENVVNRLKNIKIIFQEDIESNKYDLDGYEGYEELASAFLNVQSKDVVLKINSIEVGYVKNEPINIYKEQEKFDDVNACNYISVVALTCPATVPVGDRLRYRTPQRPGWRTYPARCPPV